MTRPGVGTIARVVLVALALSGPSVLAAHPHIFVEYRVALLFGAQGLMGLSVVWTFDEMFSSAIHATYDKNKDGRFSASETEAIERWFRRLKREGYYLQVRLDGRPIDIEDVAGFEATSADGRATYRFTVPLPPRRAGTVDIRVDDPAFFTAFEPITGSAVEARDAAGYTVQCRVGAGARSSEPPAINCAYRPKS